jgi:hypothetical protein
VDIATHPRNVRFCHESGYTPKDFELNRIMSDVVRIVERANSASNVKRLQIVSASAFCSHFYSHPPARLHPADIFPS